MKRFLLEVHFSPRSVPEIMSYFNRALQFLNYAYLIRIPLLTWALLMGLWLGSFSESGAEPILRGIFDVASSAPFLSAFSQFAAVTLAALLAGTSIGVSSRLVVCNAHARFRSVPVELSPGLELLFRLIPLSSFAVVVGTTLVRSESNWLVKLLGLIVGSTLWYFITIGARNFAASQHSGWVSTLRAGGWIPPDEPGYLDPESRNLQGRHLFATYQLLLALCAYLVYGISGVVGHFNVPTLSLVLMMLTLVCWALSGTAFFLDRYRVPLLIPIVALVSLGGLFTQSDYFYQGLPLSDQAIKPLNAAEIMAKNGNTPMILVATTGGGIQAAGWTARVLTGLNEEVNGFSPHIRLISSVSGGSVGALYFSAAYRNGEVPKADSNTILANAEESSLDQVAWGLSYPDLLFVLFPWLKDGNLAFMDRGRILESSWRNRLPDSQHDATLASWKTDAAQGLRPAVIFNSTLVESGDRYLLSSTAISDNSTSQTGRWEFFKLYPDSDLRLSTAARLSATFPYVTPASRMLRPGGRIYHREAHAVDGGYYDNYGMASLLDWLDDGLQSIPARPKVLIIEIRASPVSKETRPQSSSYGTLFQLTHPLRTLENVRGTGQLSHNLLDEALINRLYSPNICEATFEFSNTDARGCPREEPLNWHLTPDDRRALQAAWSNSETVKQSIKRVQSFLAEGACPR